MSASIHAVAAKAASALRDWRAGRLTLVRKSGTEFDVQKPHAVPCITQIVSGNCPVCARAIHFSLGQPRASRTLTEAPVTSRSLIGFSFGRELPAAFVASHPL